VRYDSRHVLSTAAGRILHCIACHAALEKYHPKANLGFIALPAHPGVSRIEAPWCFRPKVYLVTNSLRTKNILYEKVLQKLGRALQNKNGGVA
jgi:hypothetical protein